MNVLTVDALSEIRLGKMRSAGIWIEGAGTKKERVIVRVRKTKNSWFEQRTFSVSRFQEALDFYNSCAHSKVRLKIENQANNEVMRLPLFTLIEETISAMSSRRSEPWASKSEITVGSQIYLLKRFRDRYFSSSNPEAEEINLSLDDLRNPSAKADRLKLFEKATSNKALKLIGNMTLEDVKKIAAEHDSDNGFKILIEKVCFTKNTAKNTATVVREFLDYIRRKKDPERSVTGWFPTEKDFKGLRLKKDNSAQKNNRRYYSPKDVKKILAAWMKRCSENLSLNQDYPLLFELGLYAGPRIGELASLTVADIEYSEKRLRIYRTATQNLKNKRVLGEKTKNGKERFTLQLPDILMEKLRAHVGNKLDTDLVFKSKIGSIVSTGSFNESFKNICEKAGVKYLSSHQAMRKTFINLAIRRIMQLNGNNFEAALATVAKASGHSIEMCRKSYYVFEETEASLANQAVVSLYELPVEKTAASVDPRDEKIAHLEAEIMALKLKSPAPTKRKVRSSDVSPGPITRGLKAQKNGRHTNETESDEAA